MDAKTLCLGALALGDASGYEIKKMFEEGPFAHFHHVGFGSIYPALAVLAQEGKILVAEDAGEGHPARKIYSLTQTGKDALKKAMRKTPAPDKVRSEAIFMMFFSQFLEDDHLEDVFNYYLACYKAGIEKIKSLDDEGISDGRRFIRGMGLASYQAIANYMEENRHLLFGTDKQNSIDPAGLSKRVGK